MQRCGNVSLRASARGREAAKQSTLSHGSDDADFRYGAHFRERRHRFVPMSDIGKEKTLKIDGRRERNSAPVIVVDI